MHLLIRIQIQYKSRLPFPGLIVKFYLSVKFLAMFRGILFFSTIFIILTGCKNNKVNYVPVSEYTYVGRSQCVDCHKEQHELFKGSHHDKAMDPANSESVLGDFNNVVFDHLGVQSKFYMRDSSYYCYTEGSDGSMQEFKISYTFGYYPLQQYLVEFPRGNYQCLPLCWDSRTKEEGGQQWFHIYDNERIPHNDILYWTTTTQTWNFMCAECHSTNLKKNYTVENRTYHTTWTEIDVSCEACHGPGSEHVKWAEADELGEPTDQWKDMGMAILMADTNDFPWKIVDSTGNSVRTEPLKSDVTIEMCARCHSRRAQLTEEYTYGGSILNTHDVRLLDNVHYFLDGQIMDEDYVYASFVQSKMYQKGVRCVDCHDAHSGERIAEGDDVCMRCHSDSKFAQQSHHFHDPNDEGASCIGCHMPDRYYMVVDARNDHSFRIPRPDLTQKIGVPNACNHCHDDKSTEWAVDYFKQWYDLSKYPKHFGEVFADAVAGKPSAEKELVQVANDTALTGIVRATSLYYLQNFPTHQVAAGIRGLLANPDPFIRAEAVQTLSFLPIDQLKPMLFGLLDDKVLLVRSRAYFALMSLDKNALSTDELKVYSKAENDYLQIQHTNSDVTAGLLNLGVYHYRNGDMKQAESYYRKSIETEPYFDGSYINLADLYRNINRDNDGLKVLEEGVNTVKNSAALYHALGLNQVRQQQTEGAMKNLEAAAQLQENNIRYQYVYAIALNSTGKSDKAIQVLKESLSKAPYDAELLYALATINADIKNTREALKYANKLVEYYPENSNFRALANQLSSFN